MFINRIKSFFAGPTGRLVKSPENESGGSGTPIIAFVLLQDAPTSLDEAVAKVEKVKFGGAKASEVTRENGTAVFKIGDETAAISLMPAPFPSADLVAALDATWLLPDSVPRESIRNHKRHVIVTIMGGSGVAVDRLLVASKLTAVVARLPGAIVVIWGGANNLIHAPVFVKLAENMTSRDAPPFYLWVNLRAGPNPDGTIHFATQGLTQLGHMEIEIPSTRRSAGELREWLPDVFLYLLEKGPVLKPGQTLGPDEKTMFKIAHQPSSFGQPGTVITLSEQ